MCGTLCQRQRSWPVWIHHGFLCPLLGSKKGGVISTIRNFHKRCVFEKSFNSTYVALIPKDMGAKEFTHFKPIS